MKHAGAASLHHLAPLLEALRALALLQERQPGVFYRKGSAFLHFHEDPSGLFADAKLDGRQFSRWPVDSPPQWQGLLQAVRASLV